MNPQIEYPSLKEAADAASSSAQRTFLRLNIAQLAILIISALISGWTPGISSIQRSVALSVAILMFAALGITTMLRLTKFDDRWFRCRALAENVKSAVWYFVMSPANSATESEAAYLAEVERSEERRGWE